ncbi:hypothetical protein BDY21DRAFT_290817 [Lineolata rhizophorae]|uniref:Uncharacterized protein n=1 Tax=Lineolata rhizophorae TaxID=578093 RepID=A0A6A6NSS6_9PEZI|nr:hypothetical protein BDY21DRAFT_290817 [Lineolata rhizophorae]
MFWGKSFDAEKDIPDLSGKVILVTGSNTGLGKESVLQLVAHKPARVYLAARTPAKAEAAIADIKSHIPEAPITFLQLDLTSFESIKNAATTFKSESDRLDILMNNAGVMATPYSKTSEGYELQFGTNHVGHALLTKLLLPTLQRTAEEAGSDVRVINVTSAGHMMAPASGVELDMDALEKVNTMKRYGNSKLANILFAREFARRYPSITSVAVHPGVIFTDLYQSLGEKNFLLRWGTKLSAPFVMGTPQAGAKNQLWAATVPKAELENGAYYVPIGSKSGGTNLSRDPEQAKKLWEWTENEFAKHGIQ